MQNINFISQIVFEILKFKNSAIWLLRPFLHITLEPDFFWTCSFNRIIKVIMVHDLNPKILHINGLFFVRSKTPCFRYAFWHYPQNEIFSWKSGSVRFLPLRHPNFMKYWQWWNHRIPFRLKVGIQKTHF